MPINAHPEYMNAEGKFHGAKSDEEKILALEEMIKWVPKHKGAETLRQNLKSRYKKLKGEFERKKKSKSGKKGIKKSDLQAILVGLTNSGKSSILKTITNAEPRIASYGFTTSEPEVGTMYYKGCYIQIIDLPPIASEKFDKGIVNNADTVLIVVERINDIKEVLNSLKNLKENAKKIIVFNKIDLYDWNAKRKIYATLKSRKYNFVLISALTKEGIEELKEEIFNSFGIIRVYTRQQGNKGDNVPVIMKPSSTLEDVAEKLLHGYSKKIKFAKIWGPSSKFSGQQVGLKHIMKDRDSVEFVTE